LLTSLERNYSTSGPKRWRKKFEVHATAWRRLPCREHSYLLEPNHISIVNFNIVQFNNINNIYGYRVICG
jgi:hypothetical protein